MKVLLIEDDADARELVRWTLERDGGFSVEECATARTALDAARRMRPDLVLLDVMLPDLDGLAAARALRADSETAGAGIVFMTACLRPADFARYAEAGALDVIAKPFDPRKLPGRAELPERIGDIERALAGVSSITAGVAQQAALLAHRLAGSAAVFGMDGVSETARALEDALGRFLLEDAEASRRSIEGLVGELRRRADAAAAGP